jgi:hypothetical protein
VNLEPHLSEPLSLWLPAFSVILATNLAVALAARPLRQIRWLLAAFVLTAPATLPALHTYSPRTWGILDTVATTMAVVSAARLPALNEKFKSASPKSWELFFWMTVPVARLWQRDASQRSRNRRRAGRLLLSALLKRLAWEPFGYLTTWMDGDAIPWPARSAVLIFYFVLNITAAADALSAVCLLLGFEIDVLFDAPLLSRSPRDFWSSRWNRFISRFALKHVALPLGRRWGASGIIFAVFATSGVFHEYFAWGVSADGARHSLMLAFFVLQGVMVWLGTRFSFPPVPHAMGTALTFVWMAVTAPMFFAAVEPALMAFGYPQDWLPFDLLIDANLLVDAESSAPPH